MATFHYVPLHSLAPRPHARRPSSPRCRSPTGSPRRCCACRCTPQLARRRRRPRDRRRTGDRHERRRPAPHLSLVLACYNEAEHLEASFAEIRETLEQTAWPFEIIFVDDVSRDRTPEILRSIVAAAPRAATCRLILHERNQGPRGHRDATASAPRAARSPATSTWTSRSTAATSPRSCARSRRAPTSRRSGGSTRSSSRSLDRYFMSRGYSWLVRRLLGLPFRDTETGYKFFRRATVLPLLDEIEDGGWFWDTEFMARAARRGLAGGRDPRRLHPARRQDLDRERACATRSLLPAAAAVPPRARAEDASKAPHEIEGPRRDRLAARRALRLLHAGDGAVPPRARAAAAGPAGCGCSGARIGRRAVLHDVRFFNLYRRGLARARDRRGVLHRRRVPARPRRGRSRSSAR